MNDTDINRKQFILSIIITGFLIISLICSIFLPSNNKITSIVKTCITMISLVGTLLSFPTILKVIKNKKEKNNQENPFIIEERTISIGMKTNSKKVKELKKELDSIVAKQQMEEL